LKWLPVPWLTLLLLCLHPHPQPSQVGAPPSDTPSTPAFPSDEQENASVLEDAQEKDPAQDIEDTLIAGLDLKPLVQVSSPAASSQEGPQSRIDKTLERKKKPPMDIHMNDHP
ncbi:hypothetical protein U1Q18_049435, partial [Sarracenia purpurea var. burkii]